MHCAVQPELVIETFKHQWNPKRKVFNFHSAMMLKFWGEWKLLPQSAFKVYSFWYSIQKDKLSQYASSCCHTPAACCQWHCLLCLCHRCPVPWKRLTRTHGLLPATHEHCHHPHPQAFNPARAMSRLLLESGDPNKAAVQAQAKHNQKKPSRLKGSQKEPAQTSLSEGTWASFIGRRRLSCNTDLIQQLPRWSSMTSG